MASANYFGSENQLQPDIVSFGRQWNAQTANGSGEISYTHTRLSIAPNSGTSETITAITGADNGDLAIIRAQSGYTLEFTTTNFPALEADVTVDNNSPIMLMYDGSAWLPLTISGGSGGSSSAFSGALLTLSADQTISSGFGKTNVLFDTVITDTDSYYTASTKGSFFAPFAGYFVIKAQLSCDTSSSGIRNIEISSPSPTSKEYASIQFDAEQSIIQCISPPVYFASGIRVVCQTNQTSGVSLDVNAPVSSPSSSYGRFSWFSIEYLGS